MKENEFLLLYVWKEEIWLRNTLRHCTRHSIPMLHRCEFSNLRERARWQFCKIQSRDQSREIENFAESGLSNIMQSAPVKVICRVRAEHGEESSCLELDATRLTVCPFVNIETGK